MDSQQPGQCERSLLQRILSAGATIFLNRESWRSRCAKRKRCFRRMATIRALSKYTGMAANDGVAFRLVTQMSAKPYQHNFFAGDRGRRFDKKVGGLRRPLIRAAIPLPLIEGKASAK